MLNYNSIGRAWFFLTFLAYLLTQIIGIKIVGRFFEVSGFAAIPYLRLIFVGTVAIIMIILLPFHILRKSLRLDSNDFKILMLLLSLGVIGLSMGLYNQNPLVYLVSDTVYLIFGFGIYYFTRIGDVVLTVNSSNIKRWIVFITLFSMILFVSGFINAFPVIFLVLSSLCAYALYINRFWLFAFSVLAISLICIGGNRTMPMTIFVLLAIVSWKMFREHRFSTVLKYALPPLVIGLTVLLIFFMSGKLTTENLSKSQTGLRVIRTISVVSHGFDISRDLAIEQRFYEVTVVRNALNENPLYWLLGYGAGGTVDMTSSEDPNVKDSALLGQTKVHSIHFLPVAIAFRYGLIGCLLVLFTFWKTLRLLLQAKDGTILVNCLNLLGIMIYSLTASSFMITEPILWFSIASLFNNHFQRRTQLSV